MIGDEDLISCSNLPDLIFNVDKLSDNILLLELKRSYIFWRSSENVWSLAPLTKLFAFKRNIKSTCA